MSFVLNCIYLLLHVVIILKFRLSKVLKLRKVKACCITEKLGKNVTINRLPVSVYIMCSILLD